MDGLYTFNAVGRKVPQKTGGWWKTITVEVQYTLLTRVTVPLFAPEWYPSQISSPLVILKNYKDDIYKDN